MKFVYISTLLSLTLICIAESNATDFNEEELDFPSSILDLVEKVKDFLSGKTEQLQKCQKKKDSGEIPSAHKLDSPLETFGFPHFNVKSRSITLRPGVTLSNIFQRQPVKLGSRDYIVCGYAKELLLFFQCFENYKVIGSSLDQDGHWKANTGTLKVQMSNVNPQSQSLNAELWEMLFKISMDRIIKYLNPIKIISEKEALVLGSRKAVSNANEFERAIEKIKEWLPGSEDFIEKLKELYKKKGDIKEKVKEFIDFMKAEQKKKAALEKQWVGMDNLDKNGKIMVTLTMYSKPENRARTTYSFDKASVKMGDIANAIKLILDPEN